MKASWIAFVGIGLIVAPALAQQKITLKDQKDKVSYSIGRNIGGNMKQQQLDLNTDALAAGIRDSLSGAPSLLTDQEMQAVMLAFQKEMMAKEETRAKEREARAKEEAPKNKKAGEDFLAANKKKEGVKTLPSGLQYKIIKEGTGRKPAATDVVSTHYRGTLINGTEFDSSYKGGEPVEFPLNQVIPGWTEGIQLMPVGSKWQLFIPSDLAYGETGAGEDVPPSSTLIFEVELLGIKDGKAK
jgi:FKBP-type peptidyl-prolyl cis-trans isomerase FklB